MTWASRTPVAPPFSSAARESSMAASAAAAMPATQCQRRARRLSAVGPWLILLVLRRRACSGAPSGRTPNSTVRLVTSGIQVKGWGVSDTTIFTPAVYRACRHVRWRHVSSPAKVSGVRRGRLRLLADAAAVLGRIVQTCPSCRAELARASDPTHGHGGGLVRCAIGVVGDGGGRPAGPDVGPLHPRFQGDGPWRSRSCRGCRARLRSRRWRRRELEVSREGILAWTGRRRSVGIAIISREWF